MLFGSFGLTARPNALVAAITSLSALSISNRGFFVILRISMNPMADLFGVPSTSMRNALADMMRPTADGHGV